MLRAHLINMMEFQPDQDKENRIAVRKLIASICMVVFAIPILIGIDLISDFLGIKTYRGTEGLLLGGVVIWLFLVIMATRCIMFLKFGAITRQDVQEAVEKSRQATRDKLGTETYEGLLYYRREIGHWWIMFASVFVPVSVVGPLAMGIASDVLEDLKIAGCAVILSLMFAWLVAIIKTRKKYPGSMEKIRAFYRSPSNFKG